MTCLAHIVNLIVNDGLKDVNESIARVKTIIRYVKHSLVRLQKFKAYVEVKRIQCKGFLHLDVSTKWNFTYLCQTQLKSLKEALKDLRI